MPDELINFLTARLDEDEQTARAATTGAWDARPYIYGAPEDGWGEPSHFEVIAGGYEVVSHQPFEGGGIGRREDAEHVARYSPARVLADVDAKRRIVQWHFGARDAATPWGEPVVICHCGYDQPCSTLRMLALPYAYHPDYDEAWRP